MDFQPLLWHLGTPQILLDVSDVEKKNNIPYSCTYYFDQDVGVNLDGVWKALVPLILDLHEKLQNYGDDFDLYYFSYNFHPHGCDADWHCCCHYYYLMQNYSSFCYFFLVNEIQLCDCLIKIEFGFGAFYYLRGFCYLHCRGWTVQIVDETN